MNKKTYYHKPCAQCVATITPALLAASGPEREDVTKVRSSIGTEDETYNQWYKRQTDSPFDDGDEDSY